MLCILNKLSKQHSLEERKSFFVHALKCITYMNLSDVEFEALLGIICHAVQWPELFLIKFS